MSAGPIRPSLLVMPTMRRAIARRGRPASWRLVGLALILAVALGASALATPLTRGVYGGVITVGRGAAGIRLGMTRSEVIARLGRPFSGKNGYMQYAYMPPGYVPPNVEHGLFDVYLRDGRVRMIIIGAHKGFRLCDGNRVFERGAVARLMRRYGRRLKAMRYEGEPLYRITGRYMGKTVWTDFWPERFGPNTKIMGVDVLFPPA
jgi:hypothetical protein